MRRLIIIIAVLSILFAGCSEKEYCETRELASLDLIREVHGDFYLASGTFGGEFYYVYYEITPKGGFKLRKVQANYESVTVYEEDIKSGYVVYEGYYIDNYNISNGRVKVNIHIPIGSVYKMIEQGEIWE